MDPVVGSILGLSLAAFVGGFWAYLQAQRVAKSQEQAASNTAVIESVKTQIDGWDRLADSYRTELERLHALAHEQATEIDRLQKQHKADRIEIEWCRTNHPPLGDE